jgi:hypothetical protein
MLRLLLALIPLLMAACTTLPPPEKVAGDEEDVVCELGSSTGSNRLSRQCRTAAQREKDKAAVEAFGNQVRRNAPGSSDGAR